MQSIVRHVARERRAEANVEPANAALAHGFGECAHWCAICLGANLHAMLEHLEGHADDAAAMAPQMLAQNLSAANGKPASASTVSHNQNAAWNISAYGAAPSSVSPQPA